MGGNITAISLSLFFMKEKDEQRGNKPTKEMARERENNNKKKALEEERWKRNGQSQKKRERDKEYNSISLLFFSFFQ